MYSYNLPNIDISSPEHRKTNAPESSTKSDLAISTSSTPDYKFTSHDVVQSEMVLANKSKEGRSLTTRQFVYILCLTELLNATLNGVVPSTSSYACLPYGSLAFTLAVRISAVANPLICFTALFLRHKSLLAVGVLSLMVTGLTTWHLYLAIMSPFPPLKHTLSGTVLVVSTLYLDLSEIQFISLIIYL